MSDDQLRGWIDDALPQSATLSIEAHVRGCEACRHRCASAANDEASDVAVRWDGLADRLDGAPGGIVERLARTLGVPSDTARLLAATPSLQLPWWLSVTAVLLLTTVMDRPAPARDGWLFLALAPIVPVIGIGLAFGRGSDPMDELAVAAPMNGLRLLLVRSLAVLSLSILLAFAASLLPGLSIGLVLWLLPSLALSGLTLALETWVAPRVAAGAVGLGWFVLIGWMAGPGRHQDVVGSGNFNLVLTVLLLASIGLIAARRDRFDAEHLRR